MPGPARQARRDPRRNIVTRSLGPGREVEPDVFAADVSLRPGDHIVVLDNSGWEREVEISRVGQEHVSGQVVHVNGGHYMY